MSHQADRAHPAIVPSGIAAHRSTKDYPMSWDNKVIWSEGLFLRPQHFQQADRYIEKLVRSRVAALRPYPWGITELKLNRDMLSLGKFALLEARGVLEDGTPFSIP